MGRAFELRDRRIRGLFNADRRRPAVIERITNLKTCNLSEGAYIVDIVGTDEPLQHYLLQNSSPRFLLTMWTSSQFRPMVAPFTEYHPDGVIYGLDYLNRRTFVPQLLRRPTWVLSTLVWSLHGLIEGLQDGLAGTSRNQTDARQMRLDHQGQFVFPLPPETHCVRSAFHLTPGQVNPYEDDVMAFRRKYSSARTTVIVNISAVPVCDSLYEAYGRESAGLHDNSFEQLPIADFNQGDVHFSRAGSEHMSEEAGHQILALMRPKLPLATVSQSAQTGQHP